MSKWFLNRSKKISFYTHSENRPKKGFSRSQLRASYLRCCLLTFFLAATGVGRLWLDLKLVLTGCDWRGWVSAPTLADDAAAAVVADEATEELDEPIPDDDDWLHGCWGWSALVQLSQLVVFSSFRLPMTASLFDALSVDRWLKKFSTLWWHMCVQTC